jgi:hypothetical protein
VKRLLVLVEGQTEETFVRDVLAPHLAEREIWPEPTRVATKLVAGRRAHRGGGGTYKHIRDDLSRLLASSPTAVTTLLDYYGLPGDFPGLANVPAQGSCFERAAHIEQAFSENIADARFIPGLILHEFEGLLFSGPGAIAEVLLAPTRAGQLEAIARAHASPEEIDDGPRTHPSKRIRDLFESYEKARHGPLIALRIGLETIRARCRHFAAWLSRVEAI